MRQEFIQLKHYYDLESFIGGTLKASILKFSAPTENLNINAHRFQIGDVDIWNCCYGEPISLSFGEGNYFRIQFHEKGLGITKMEGREYGVTANSGVISFSDTQIFFGQDFVQKVVRINKDKLCGKLLAYSGQPLIKPLEFEVGFNCEDKKVQTFIKARLFVETLFSNAPVSPAMVAELEQMLMVSMLSSFNHNYSHIFENNFPMAAPAQVRRVESYIEDNWDQPLIMEDIVAISGCSARSIFRAFRANRDYTPMQFAKMIRLKHARKMLQELNLSVTQVALACGFSDLGRFSRDYRSAYGELPSQTHKNKMA